MSDNFDEIVQGDRFKQLSKDELTSLHANLSRNVVQERSLYTAIINWIKYDQNRKNEFSSLFLILDLKKLSHDFIAGTVVKEPLVKMNNDCLNAVVSYLVRNTCCTNEEKIASKILCIGGKGSKSVAEVYNLSGESINKHYPDLPDALSYHCTLKVDNTIYCIGGAIEGDYEESTNIYRLNLKDAKLRWQKVASLAEKRSYFGAAVFKGCLVAAGGHNGKSKLKTIEVYDPSLNEVRKIKSLSKSRDQHVLVATDEKLFTIGGLGAGGDRISSVEQMDMDILGGRWKTIEPINVKRRLFAAVTCNNCIYAIGGCSKFGHRETIDKSVEMYDINKSKWSFVSSMNVARYEHAACVLGGKIFVVGGKDRNNKVVKTIECYDPTTNAWTIVGETKQELFGHAVVAI